MRGALVSRCYRARARLNGNLELSRRINIVRHSRRAEITTQDAAGAVFHTYSCYARGLDMMNAAYHYLDLVPKGRDESGPHKMAWVRYRDSYGG
jgi:predicted dithiol-disulfide oxidoreductase (DUF899 family)